MAFLNQFYKSNMKIILASDSFKESLSSSEVNDILEKCVQEVFPEAEVHKINVADGGEGTIASIINQRECQVFQKIVRGPLPGMKVKADWILLNNGKDAVIESASVIGLSLLATEKRNPCITSTYGIGEIIESAADLGVERIYLGLGGSSTNDAGSGIAIALGVKFLDKNNKSIPPGGKSLKDLVKVDTSGISEKIKNIRIICLCDVENTLCGPFGASCVFAPQKGASEEEVISLDGALENFANIIQKDLNIDILNLKGGGAAGGIAAGLSAFFNTEIKSGINTILDIIDFNGTIAGADLVITGEGKIDFQTLFGKVIAGIASRAHVKRIPIIAFCGILADDKERIMKELGLLDIFTMVNGKTSKEDSLNNPEKYLYERGLESMLWYRKNILENG
jgi:glycerate 2-kinase